LAKEIKLAMGKRDSLRAADLSQHMQALLVRGVAGNLAIVKELGPDEKRENELLRVRQEIMKVTQEIEAEFASHPDVDRDRIMLKAVTQGKTEIEKAVQGKGTGKVKQ